MKMSNFFKRKFKLKLVLAVLLKLTSLSELILQFVTGYSESPILYNLIASTSSLLFFVIFYPLELIWLPYHSFMTPFLLSITGVEPQFLYKAKILGVFPVNSVHFVLGTLYAYIVSATFVELFLLARKKLKK